MEENQVLNQEQDVAVDETTEDDFFADSDFGENDEEFDEEETTEVEPVKEETPDTTEKKVEEPKPFSLHVKYNGEEKDLGEEEARTLAQKGMNYDHFYEPLQKLARLNGLSVGDYINKLSDTQTAYEVDRELSELREQYPGTPDEVLNELAQKRVSENQNLQFQRMEQEAKGNEDAVLAEAKRQTEIFKKEYPNLNPNDLDEGVFQFVDQGYSLLEAYNKWSKIQEDKNRPIVEAKQKVDKLNEENKKKSYGSTTNAGSDEPDDFFKGLDSMF